MNNTCITQSLFGISENPCDCYTEDLDDITPADPNWYKISTSGLFLDDLESEGLMSMRASNGSLTCDKTLGTFYKESRDKAIKRTIDDVFTVINERFKSKRDGFNGQIGGNRFNKTFVIPNAVIAGVVLSPNAFVDGVFKLNRITVGSSINRVDVTLSIFRIFPTLQDVDPELIENIENVVTVAGRSTITILTDPIILPMEVDGEPVKYIIIRELADGEALPNTGKSCGCGRKEYVFNQYATYDGIVINDDAESMADYNISGYTNGITLDGEFSCDSESIICRMFYKSAAFKKVFAYAAMYLAAAMVNERVLRADEITRWSMVNFDDIKASSLNFRGEYSNRITWLSQNTDPSVNDCYNCGTKNQISMSVTNIRKNYGK